ncbi:MAG TPA: hypothetical protein HPP94_12720 [Desulfuromonadales bacterium]|nr:hypothetical protein [Desulfuromonadales bacterium]
MATKIIYPALSNYQRKWLDYSVDKNLQDEWLVRLNSLKIFYPTNVCEGHATCDDAYPHIVLLSRADYLDRIDNLIRNIELTKHIRSCLPESTVFKLSSLFAITNEPDTHFGDHIVKLSLSRETPRESLDFFEQDANWFELVVSSAEQIDKICLELLDESSSYRKTITFGK